MLAFMGRKAAFDREAALQEALKAFWWDGYDKTSLEDLLKCMGIKTSSFYNSFESKEALFFEALQYYRQNIGSVRIGILNSPNIGGKEALLKYFDHLVFHKGEQDFPSGCFMMKTAVNLTNPDSKVGKEVSNSIANLEKGFSAALFRGQESGDFSKKLDIENSARLLVAAAYGVSVLSRTKKSKKELLSTAHALVDMLTSKS